MCSPSEDHGLVPSLPDNLKSQTHSRVSECDVADLLSRSNQVQSTEWSLHPQVFQQICQKWFTPHVDLFATRLNHKLPLYMSPVPDHNPWNIDALNINWPGLTAYAYPSTALLHRVIQKIRQCNCLIIVIAPGCPGMPWFLDIVQFSTEIPLQLPVSTTLLKQSHNYVFHRNQQHLNLYAWCLGVDSSKNKASLWRWQRELLTLKDHGRPLLTPWAQLGTIFPKTQTLTGCSPISQGSSKSSRNLPKWNLSDVLNELTKAPFEPLKDTDLKHLTLKIAFLLALASGKHRSEVHARVANKVSNLGQWEQSPPPTPWNSIITSELARYL